MPGICEKAAVVYIVEDILAIIPLHPWQYSLQEKVASNKAPGITEINCAERKLDFIHIYSSY